MPDYGRPLNFGYFLIPNADSPLLSIAQDVEKLGLDYIAVQDHPYQRRFVDTWTLLSMIAATTSRVGLFPDVANLPLRPPAIMAKAAASIDLLSGGRFELGLGAGAFWDGIEAYGGPRGTPGTAVAALREGIEVIRRVMERRPQPAFRRELLPAARRPFRPRARPSNWHLARRDRTTGAQAGWRNGGRLGPLVSRGSKQNHRDEQTPRRGSHRSGPRPGHDPPYPQCEWNYHRWRLERHAAGTCAPVGR